MATQTQTRPAQQAQPQQQPFDAARAGAMINEVLLNTTQNQKAAAIGASLSAKIETIRELLPDYLKKEADRFVKRAALYFSQSQQLEKCSPISFVICVLKAAELGLCIDGRLAYAVPYNGVAVMQCDYKGVIAVARRNRIIKDCFARQVFANDEFRMWEEDGQTHLIHRPVLTGAQGDVIGCYAKVILHDGDWKCEWMTLGEIEAIRNAKSQAWKQNSGPWVTDPGEMQKKTVIKRALKTYADDPAIGMLLAFDEGELEDNGFIQSGSLPATRSDIISAKLSGTNGASHAKMQSELPDQDQQQPEPQTENKAAGEEATKGLRIIKNLLESIAQTTSPQGLELLKADVRKAQTAGQISDDEADQVMFEIVTKIRGAK